MFRLFKHYIPKAVLLLALFDALLLMMAAEAAWVLRAHQIGMTVEPLYVRWIPMVSFALVVQLGMIGVGVYGTEALQSVRFALMRLLTAVSLGIILLATLYFVFPSVALWRSNLAYAMPLAVLGPILLRFAFTAALGGEAFRRRILVLGAGSRAGRIADLARSSSAGFNAVGFVAMTDEAPAVPAAVHRTKIDSLADHVVALNVGEVVLALEERRNALPLDDLLRIKTTGVHVNEISSFLERETGRVDLATVNPSWFIFSDGFTAGQRVSKVAKRLFDIVASLLVLLIMGPVVLIAAILVKLDSPGPALYRQRRVGLYGQPYDIFKLRSMRQDAEAGGKAIWAAEADPRITRIGRFLRMTRIDEIPQAWNVLKGEMSFVGPRPERPEFVQELEREIPYYAERHMVKPGLTGWAQINYPYGASIEDARCKLEYDLYYAKNYTPFLDLLILLQTLRVVLWPEGVR
ncbi:TIGR03013 family PEP-CTERM/XrtA system glycosyltransferase [Sphingomonas lacunae]|uniref:TIGR03013 family PEP-CTERM/XrtA system glycosyltransferase n=1 Tax=Sphingomonas lacunae TaxID=2698828 RepID=A0A6M4AQ18_9SPHN|nr:TIGR03013 family XrtA/PEP-CTERM system glycosyltransferase [Sphingomonas lacunae]QJQ31097.1 TIGR03013 family PEP-CTERM/XrtA system glycosyltransferase [Sphingomonas lacunae]